MKKKYLIAFSAFGDKGFNHPTLLVSAKDQNDALDLAKHHHPGKRVSDIKEVDY